MTSLSAIEDALAGLTDAELHALAKPSNWAPQIQIAPGLLAWIQGACGWERSRRAGRHYELLPPDEAAIDLSEDAVSVEGANAMRAMFAASGRVPAVLRLFDAVADLLTGGEWKH